MRMLSFVGTKIRCPRGNKWTLPSGRKGQTETLLNRPTTTRKAPAALILTTHGGSYPSGLSPSATGFSAASEGFVLSEGVWGVLFVVFSISSFCRGPM
jgi:hypothetical protein